MAIVKVYRFDFYDPLLKHDRRSTEYATADAIAERHGRVLVETERLVEEDLLDESGTILAHRIPPPEMIEAPPPAGGQRPAA